MGSLNQNAGMTLCVSKAGLTAGTTSSYTTAAAVNGFIRGKFVVALAAQTNTATPTLDANTGVAFLPMAADQGCVFVKGINAAGVIQVAQGVIETMDGDSDEFLVSPEFPDIPTDFLPFGYVVVTLDGSASAWTYGASNWTATGVTDNYQDIGVMPDRRQES